MEFYFLALSFSSSMSMRLQFLLHTVKKIGTAVVLAQLEVGIDAVAVLRLHIEQGVEERGKFTDGNLTVVDAAYLRCLLTVIQLSACQAPICGNIQPVV